MVKHESEVDDEEEGKYNAEMGNVKKEIKGRRMSWGAV